MDAKQERAYVLKSYYNSAMKFLGSEDRSKNPTKISVLPLSYDCPRRRFLKAQEVDREFFNLQTINRFLRGRLGHLLPVFADGEYELELIWEGIVGHPDDYDPIHKILVDKKFTFNPPKGGSWSDPIATPPPARAHNAKQVEYYKVLLEEGTDFDGKPSNREVRKAYVLYVNFSSDDYMPQPAPVKLRKNVDIKKEMRERRDEYKKALLENKIPDGDMGWGCRYCEFFNLCFDKRYTSRWRDDWFEFGSDTRKDKKSS